MSKDLLLIAGDFLEKTYQIPKQKLFLYKYFRTDIQKAFVRYWVVFGECNHRLFIRHSGHFCKIDYLRRMRRQVKKLERLYSKAKTELDFSTITVLETGKFKLGR